MGHSRIFSFDDETNAVLKEMLKNHINLSKFFRDKVREWKRGSPDMNTLKQEIFDIKELEEQTKEKRILLEHQLKGMEDNLSNIEIKSNIDALETHTENVKKENGKPNKNISKLKELLETRSKISHDEIDCLLNKYKESPYIKYSSQMEKFLKEEGYVFSGVEIVKETKE